MAHGILGDEWIQEIRNRIDEFGATVTVRTISKSFGNDEYRALTETTSDTASVKAWVHQVELGDNLEKGGIWQAGDFVFWFKDSRSGIIANGNRIQLNSVWYEIVETIAQEVGDTVYLVEARTKKV